MSASGAPQADLDRARRLARARRELGDLAWLLDESIRVPGTRFRFGLEPIIGLIPGAGDLLSGALGLYIVARALGHGLPGVVVARMVANTLLDLAIGAIPVLGDLFDFAYKSNRRNIELFERHASDPTASTRSDRIFFGILLAICGAVLLGAGWLLAQVLGGIEGLLRGDPL